MGNCFPSAYKWIREKAGTHHRMPNFSSMHHHIRDNHPDLEFENLMLSDETIQAAQRWFKKTRKKSLNESKNEGSESPYPDAIGIENSNFLQTGQIMDPAIFLTSADSNYYSWISTNDDAPDDETPTAAGVDGQCEVFIANSSTKHSSSTSTGQPRPSWMAKFKKYRQSHNEPYSRHPYSQLLSTPNSENSGGTADLEWEPEAAMLPFLSAELRWEYLNNQAKRYGTTSTCNVIGGDYTNLSVKQTNVQQKATKGATNCSTPRSGRSSSPALEWDPDDIMDPETSELLTEIDRIAQNLDQSAWSA